MFFFNFVFSYTLYERLIVVKQQIFDLTNIYLMVK